MSSIVGADDGEAAIVEAGIVVATGEEQAAAIAFVVNAENQTNLESAAVRVLGPHELGAMGIFQAK